MKKLLACSLLIAGSLLQFCSPTKRAQKAPATTFEANVLPLLTTHCSPCHIPPNGKRDQLNTYTTAKAHADDMIRRIQLNPSDKGFMPFKHPKLPDSTIQVF